MPYTDSLAAISKEIIDASAWNRRRAIRAFRSVERVLTYTHVPAGGCVSIVKTYGVPVESPALRGAIAWATRRSGRQVEFAHGRAIGFEQI